MSHKVFSFFFIRMAFHCGRSGWSWNAYYSKFYGFLIFLDYCIHWNLGTVVILWKILGKYGWQKSVGWKEFKNLIFQERKSCMEAIMLSHDQPLKFSKNVNKIYESIISSNYAMYLYVSKSLYIFLLNLIGWWWDNIIASILLFLSW